MVCTTGRALGPLPCSCHRAEDYKKHFNSVDEDEDGNVDFPEFLTLLSRAKKACEANGGEEEELTQAFKVFNP